MKVTKKQLKKLISEHIKLLKEERYDCIKDYMAMGYSRSEAQKECPPDEDDDDYGASYGGRSRSSYSRGGRFPKKTSHVGVEANAEKISALEASLEKKSDKFLNSVLSQLKGGRGLSAKQKAIVKKILIKTSPESVALFESSTRNYKMKITKRQLKRIIKEEKTKLLQEGGFSRIHTMIGETVLNILKDNPGIDGLELVRLVQADYGSGEYGGTDHDEIFTVLDDLQEDGQVFFNVEEDAWYTSAPSFRPNVSSQPQRRNAQHEGTSLDDMPDAWRQILGDCLKDK